MVSLGGDVCGFETLQIFYGEEPAPEKSLGDRRLTQLLITMRQALLDLLPTSCLIQLTQSLWTFKSPLYSGSALQRGALCVVY